MKTSDVTELECLIRAAATFLAETVGVKAGKFRGENSLWLEQTLRNIFKSSLGNFEFRFQDYPKKNARLSEKFMLQNKH